MSHKFQQIIDQVYENMNAAGAGGAFGPENVYGNPEKVEQLDTKTAMATAQPNSRSKKKKRFSQKKKIIRRSFPEKIWN